MDVDLYENSCYGETMPKSTVYATSDQTMARTTISPNSGEKNGITASGKLRKEVSTDFRRVRAHHTRSLTGTPLPQTAFHRLDRETSLPPLASQFSADKVSLQSETKRSQTNLQTPNEDKVVISPQLDEPSWAQKLASKPIRKGKIVPHFHATTTKAPAVTGARQLEEARDIVGTTPLTTPSKSSPCFGRVTHHHFPHFEEKTIRGVTVRQCLLTCLNTSTFFCASAHYEESKKSCTLNGGNVHLNRGKLVGRAGIDYFENRCHLGDRDAQFEQVTFPSPKISKKQESCFEERKHTVLASLDAMVIQHLSSLDECTSACSSGPIICTGLNWIPSTNGCMLFHGEIDQTQLTDGAGSSFYTNNCSGKHQATHRQTRTKNEDFYDSN